MGQAAPSQSPYEIEVYVNNNYVKPGEMIRIQEGRSTQYDVLTSEEVEITFDPTGSGILSHKLNGPHDHMMVTYNEGTYAPIFRTDHKTLSLALVVEGNGLVWRDHVDEIVWPLVVLLIFALTFFLGGGKKSLLEFKPKAVIWGNIRIEASTASDIAKDLDITLSRLDEIFPQAI